MRRVPAPYTQMVRRRNVVRAVIVLAVGTVAVTTFSALWRRAHDPLRPLAPYVYRERSAFGGTLHLGVVHVKGIDLLQTKALLEPHIFANGFSPEMDLSIPFPHDADTIYSRRATHELVEVIDGQRQHLDGVIVTYFRDANFFESLIIRWRDQSSGDIFYDSVGNDDVLRKFLGE